ncbi:MAG: hypothetical protein PHF46_02505 [Candidatus Gracilibacteria bacterium]|nr:hypothetical protein [Candidatus Gracilibacteria bacterium]
MGKMNNLKKILIGILAFTALVMLIIFAKNFYEKLSRTDNREKICMKQEIDSIEYNTDIQECFKTKISACKTPTYKDIIECKNKNKSNKKQYSNITDSNANLTGSIYEKTKSLSGTIKNKTTSLTGTTKNKTYR